MLDTLLQPEVITAGGALLGLPAVLRATRGRAHEINTLEERTDEWDDQHPWAKSNHGAQITALRKDYRVGTVSAETYDIELGLILEGKSTAYPAVAKPKPRPLPRGAMRGDTILNRGDGASGGYVPSWERPLMVDPGPGPQHIPGVHEVAEGYGSSRPVGYILDEGARPQRRPKPVFVQRWDLNGGSLLIDSTQIMEAVQCDDGTWHYTMRDGEILGPLLWEKPVQPEEQIAAVSEALLNSRGLKSQRQKDAEAKAKRLAEHERWKREIDAKRELLRRQYGQPFGGSREHRSRVGRFPL